MRTRRTITVSLPPQMEKRVTQLMRVEHRTRSELVREALRAYFNSRFPVVEAAPEELVAIRRGRAQIKRGQYITLDQLIHALANPNRKASSKGA